MFIFENERDKEEMRFKRATSLEAGDVINLTGARVIKDVGMSVKGIMCTISNPDNGNEKTEEYMAWKRVPVFGKDKSYERTIFSITWGGS